MFDIIKKTYIILLCLFINACSFSGQINNIKTIEDQNSISKINNAKPPPSDLYYHTLKAHLCLKYKDIKCSTAEFEEALKLDTQSVHILIQLTQLYALQNNFNKAVNACLKAVEI